MALALEVEGGDRDRDVAVDEAVRRAVGEELSSLGWRWKKATERRRVRRQTRPVGVGGERRQQRDREQQRDR